MKIPARYAPLLFGAILSVIMVTVVSGVVLALTQGSAWGTGTVLGLGLLAEIGRQGDRQEDTEDQHDDQHLDQGESALRAQRQEEGG